MVFLVAVVALFLSGFWVGLLFLSVSLLCFFLSAMCVAGERRAGAGNGVEREGG